jgi:hypothetical protein
MERSKIRPSDNVRTFYLSRFFIEYLLLLRRKETVLKEKEMNGQQSKQESELALGLVGEMAELDSVRWVVTRMKIAMDDKVGRACRVGWRRAKSSAPSVDGIAGVTGLLYTDCEWWSCLLGGFD